MLVARAHEAFDTEGRLTEQSTRDFLVTFLARFAELIGRFARG